MSKKMVTLIAAGALAVSMSMASFVAASPSEDYYQTTEVAKDNVETSDSTAIEANDTVTVSVMKPEKAAAKVEEAAFADEKPEQAEATAKVYEDVYNANSDLATGKDVVDSLLEAAGETPDASAYAQIPVINKEGDEANVGNAKTVNEVLAENDVRPLEELVPAGVGSLDSIKADGALIELGEDGTMTVTFDMDILEGKEEIVFVFTDDVTGEQSLIVVKVNEEGNYTATFPSANGTFVILTEETTEA